MIGALPAEAGPLRAAVRLGAMVADGLVGRGEALACLAAASAEAAPAVDPTGRRMRLAHALAGGARARALARALAWGRAEAAIRPLLDSWAAGPAILGAAEQAAAGALDADDVARLVAAAMLRRLGTTPRGRAGGRGR